MSGSSQFFALEPYHWVLAGCGLVLVLAYWLPQFVSGRTPAASGLLILGGFAAFGFWPPLQGTFDPVSQPDLWKVVSEIAVIVALFGTGVRIDRLTSLKLWQPAIGLLAIAMPLCLLGTALLGMLCGLSVGVAILLAAVLAPTDPVLAADVQIAPPLEGGGHPVRFALTTEAGLNDGLAFPFVYLGLLIISGEYTFGDWLGIYVAYKIAMGLIAGLASGWLLGLILFRLPSGNLLANHGSGVIALAGVMLTYGLCELAEGYGFIAVFIMGLMVRRSEKDHEYHRKLHDFAESIEQSLTALLLLLVGASLPAIWQYADAAIVIIGAGLIFAIRPLSGYIAQTGSALNHKERLAVAFYGIRGIGSIFYLAYAAIQTEIANIGLLWAIVFFTIILSSLVHGLTASSVVARLSD